MQDNQVIVIGAGMGGLTAAVLLAAQGVPVTVIEAQSHVGGKARQVDVDGVGIDAGPTVFTMRDVFEEIFADAGASLDDYVTTSQAEVIARHAWSETERLDLYADPKRSEAAIGDFAGAKAAAGFRAFHHEANRILEILDEPFMRSSKVSSPLPLMWRIGPARLADLNAMRPYESLWRALGSYFEDQRLRQLYGRYATYCGSSPFETPATLMLIAAVEARGVWLIEGGISALALALMRLGETLGVDYRLGQAVDQIELTRGKASGVVLDTGERLNASHVICNADPAALAAGRFGAEVTEATSAPKPQHRSLSAFTWMAHAKTSGFALKRHNVFFSPDYAGEFDAIHAGHPPPDPSVYVCAQDRDGPNARAPDGRERLQIIVNAPANGDTHEYTQEERELCTQAMTDSLARCGLELESGFPHSLATPQEFETLFPSTGGALYGRASHGWAASFLRQGTRTRIRGVYCAGGSTHPGAGVPMAALSGRLAASTVMQDLSSTSRSRLAVTAGGMSMRSAMTGGTG